GRIGGAGTVAHVPLRTVSRAASRGGLDGSLASDPLAAGAIRPRGANPTAPHGGQGGALSRGTPGGGGPKRMGLVSRSREMNATIATRGILLAARVLAAAPAAVLSQTTPVAGSGRTAAWDPAQRHPGRESVGEVRARRSCGRPRRPRCSPRPRKWPVRGGPRHGPPRSST